MRTTLLSSLLLALGLAACVTDDDAPPAPDPTDTGEEALPAEVDVDPPGAGVPGPGDGTCGGAPREKADGPCTP